MEQQSKQGPSHTKNAEDAGQGPNGVYEFPPELASQAQAAFEAEKQSVEKGIDAWKKVVASAPTAWPPRRELARVYKKAERWNAYIEVMKEAVDKAAWLHPEDKVPVLLEMVEVYRDRLKLDVMVVNAFNQILNIQPNNATATDALSAQYEQMKRWPDLISLLRKKAAVAESPSEKVSLHLRVANLFLEKFSNQAEAIKAFETILDIEPDNSQALAFLKQMYEKRRDWEKLVTVNQREIEKLTDLEQRRARRIDVAKLASEKLKKPQVSVELWKSVLAEAPDNAEALTELEKLYEREKQWSELGDILQRQADAAHGDTARRSSVLVKLGVLYTEKVQAPDKAIAAWQALADAEPENRRAQDALKKLFLQQRDWNALERFYANQNKWDELVRVLERQAETDEDASRVGLWIKVGEIYRDRLGKPDKALKAFEKALALETNNLAAAEALIPLYEKAGDVGHLAHVLGVQLAHTPASSERQARMRRLIELLDQQGGDKAAALTIALDAFAENPRDVWFQETSARLASESGLWEPLASAYEKALPALGDSPQVLPVLSVLATAYEQELARPEDAIARNQQILTLAPKDERAVEALERLYIATERFGQLLAIYDKKLELAKSKEEQLEIRFKLANLYEEEIKQLDKAVELYVAILKQDPSQLSALKALDRIFTATARWKELAAVLSREIELVGRDPAAVAELKYRRGGVLESHLAEPAGAVDSYREALALVPDHAGARAALETYLKDPERQMTAVQVLEPIYEQTFDLPRLVEVQSIKLAREKRPAERVALLLRIGGLTQNLGDEDSAWNAYAQAFREDPTALQARESLETLASALDRHGDLVALYEEALGAKAKTKLSPQLESELLLVVAVAYDEKLGQSEKAVEYFRRAQEISPGDASSLVALERLYTRTERWPDLIETLKRKVTLVTDPEERVQIRTRIASVWEEMIGNATEAVAAWRDVLSESPNDLQALRSLDRLYLARGEFRDLADNIQQQLALTQDPSETVLLLGRLGRLQEQKLSAVASAIETYRQVLAIEPDHPATIDALENILPQAEHELAVAALLEPVYRARGDFASLVAVYEVQVRHAGAPEEKIDLLRQIAEASEVGLDDPEKAYEAYGRALRERPLDVEVQGQVERLARVLGRLEDLVRRYGQLVGHVNDPAEKNALYHKIAALWEVELGRDDQAAAAYASALDTNPQDLEAANSLESIYIRANDYAHLVVLLLRKAEIVHDVPAKKELYFKAAHIYEEVLQSPEEATEVYRMVLVVDGVDIQALRELERLYSRLGRWNELKDVYAKMAELAIDLDEKKRMLTVLGQVFDRELGSPERAIETYVSILDLDPNDYDAAQALDRLYLQTERWYDLLAILEREAEMAPMFEEVVSLRYRIGELWREHLRDIPKAVEAYRQVLSMDPAHAPTLQSLETLMAGNEEPVLAAQVLEPIYESLSDWDRVVAVQEVVAAHADDRPKKVELLVRVAEIEERRLGHQTKAFDAYGRAFQVDPANGDVVAHLERLAAETNNWPRLAGLYQGQLEKTNEPSQQVDTLLKLARVYEEETQQEEEAIATLKRIVEIEPENRDALNSLDRLFARLQRWEELAEVVRREVGVAQNDAEIVSHTFRLAQIYELALLDMPKAIEAYREVLLADPTHEETRAALERMFQAGNMQVEIADVLEPLYRQGEEWEKLVQIYEAQLGRLTDVPERVSLLRRLAEIAENKLFDQVAAFEWWAKAVSEDPSSAQALDELLRLARATHQWDAYVQTMFGSVEGERPAEVKRDVLLRLAAAFENDLADLERAEKCLSQVLAEHPKDAAALVSLDRVYETQGLYENLAEILRQRVSITDASDEIVALQLRLGRINAEALNDDTQAIASYLAVIEHESRSLEALEALERLYFRNERWPELYGVYEKLVDVAKDDAEMAACYARMAKIASDALGQREKAVELWGRVVDLNGEDTIALSGLADLHEQVGEWKELTEVLEKQIAVTHEPDARIPIYKRLGRIYREKLSRDRNALEAWQQVLELDPQDLDALRALIAIYRSAGAWQELSESLRRLIQVGQTGEAGITQAELKDMYSQLGELEGETLMRTQDAIDAWREVLELDPQDFRAMAALERLFMQEARWEDAVDILKKRAAALANPTEQIDVLMQAASLLADKIGDGGSAAEVYENILQRDPSHQAASLELEQLYRQRKSWLKLINLLVDRVQFVADSPSRIALYVQAAEICEQQLDDRDNAFILLQSAFHEDFANDHVAKELERLATVAKKWNELISDYQQVVQGITDPKSAADLWVKIGHWYNSALGNVEYAIASAQQALNLDAQHSGALEALESFYRKQKQWTDLTGVLARHAEQEQEQVKKVDLLLQLADVYETQIGDAAQATLAYQRALDADERCIDAINALERLYRRTQAWDRLVEVLARKALVVEDTEQAIKLRIQVGELWENRLGDNDKAVESYKDVLSVDPQNLTALRALDQLYQKTGNAEAYLENLEHQLEVSSSDADRLVHYQRIAETWEKDFGKLDRAAEALEKILLVDDHNQSAYRDLERLYLQEKKWESLVDTYRKHILVATDTNDRVELTNKMGQVYERELRDLDRAIEAYNEVRSYEPDHVGALSGLARLYEETEQYDQAVEVMRRLVHVSTDAAQKVELNYRLGKIHDEHLQNPELAEEFLVEALSQDSTHVPTMMSLLGLYRRRGDWLKAAQLMVRAEANTQNTLEKTRLLTEAAKIQLEKLGNDEQARTIFARVIELDPEHVEAAEPLADLYFRAEEWSPLVPLLEMLARKADRRSNRELAVLYHRLAKAADKIGDNQKALKYYKQSYDLDATYLPTLNDRAALLYRLEQWDDAFRIYQTILVHHRDAQKDDDTVELFFRLGRIKWKLGERTKAVNMFEKALEIQAGHRPTLAALVELYTEAGDFEAVIKQKRAVLATSTSDDERFSTNEDIARLYQDKLKNPQKAIAAHLEALAVRPTDRPLLHQLLELFSETKQWKKVIEILVKLAELETGKVRSRYLLAAGKIANYELHSTDDAIEFFNQALDEDPSDLEAFERIDKILTGKKDWKNQERNYRKMIKRIGNEPPEAMKATQIALWHALGEVYRSRLKDYKAATAAFEVAVSLDVANAARRQILAELYQLSGPDSYEKAVAQYRTLILGEEDLNKAAVYMKTLRKLYTEMRLYDRAWCLTAALSFLRKAEPDEQQFFEHYRPKGFVRAKARLTEEQWRKAIYHPDEDWAVSQLLATVSSAYASLRAKEHREIGLKRKDRVDVQTSQVTFAKMLAYVGQVLGVAPLPDLYLLPEREGELDMANVREKTLLTPGFVVGAALLKGRTEKELGFVVGKKLAMMRADHILRWTTVVGTMLELRVLFLAAMKLGQPNLPIRQDMAASVNQYTEALGRILTPEARERLAVIVRKMLEGKAEADLPKWATAVDYTVTRAGFLICNDLSEAARLVQAEPVAIGSAEPKDKIRDLVLWSISEEYFGLREQLGLALGS